MSGRFTPHRTPLAQQIDKDVVSPHVRGALMPDTGVAKKAEHISWQTMGASSPITPIWDAISAIGSFVTKLFGGLRADDILVDVTIRTPQGVKEIFNLPLHLNAMGEHANDVRNAIEGGGTIQVKVTYDGGKPSECTPVSWRIDYPTGEQVKAAAANGGNASITTPSYSMGNGVNISGVNSGIIPPSLAAIIQNAAQAKGIDPRFLAAICQQETDFGQSSNYNAATGHDYDSNPGVGLFQLDPSSGASQADLDRAATDPVFAANYAAGMLKSALDQANGNMQLAAQIYNGGWGYRNSDQATAYGQEVMQKYAAIASQYPTQQWEGFGDPSLGRVPTVAVHSTGFGQTRSASKYRFLTDPHNILHPYVKQINAAAALFALDPNMIAAAILLRSGGIVKYVDGSGRMGLFALNPSDFQNLFQSLQNENANFAKFQPDPFDPTVSIFVGANYISDILDEHGRYKDAIIALGLGSNTVSTFKALTGDYSDTGKAYYEKFKNLWMRLQAHSEDLAGHPMDRRPEVKKQDQTGTSRYTGTTAVTQ